MRLGKVVSYPLFLIVSIFIFSVEKIPSETEQFFFNSFPELMNYEYEVRTMSSDTNTISQGSKKKML